MVLIINYDTDVKFGELNKGQSVEESIKFSERCTPRDKRYGGPTDVDYGRQPRIPKNTWPSKSENINLHTYVCVQTQKEMAVTPY